MMPKSWQSGELKSPEMKVEESASMKDFNKMAELYLQKAKDPVDAMQGTSTSSASTTEIKTIMNDFEEMVKMYNAATPEGASREVPPPPDEAGEEAETHITEHFSMTPTSPTAEIGVQTDVSYDCMIERIVTVDGPPGLRERTSLASEARRRKKVNTKAAKTKKIAIELLSPCHIANVGIQNADEMLPQLEKQHSLRGALAPASADRE